MSRKSVLILIIFVMFSCLPVGFDVAQEKYLVSASVRYPGVAQNQFLRYEFNQSDLGGNDTEWMSHRPESIAWLNLTVLEVSGNLLTFRLETYNATTFLDSSTSTFNVETGECSPHPIVPIFISANLSVGESTYTLPINNETLYINETIMMNCLGLLMETNHVHYDKTQANYSYHEMIANITWAVDYYWEKNTGVLVRGVWVENSTRSDGNGDFLESIQKTEMQILTATPIIPEFPSFLILPLFMIVTLLAVIVYRLRNF